VSSAKPISASRAAKMLRDGGIVTLGRPGRPDGRTDGASSSRADAWYYVAIKMVGDEMLISRPGHLAFAPASSMDDASGPHADAARILVHHYVMPMLELGRAGMHMPRPWAFYAPVQCNICGKMLYAPDSIGAGAGPECRGLYAARAARADAKRDAMRHATDTMSRLANKRDAEIAARLAARLGNK